MKYSLPLLCILLFPLALYSQGSGETAGQPDRNGKKIPERVVSLGPNITETLFALDRGDLLVGRTDYCDYPEEALAVPSVGTISDPSLEKILSLNPDLIIASTHAGPETLTTLEETGIPVLSLYSEESFEGVYSLIREVASAVDASRKGEELIAGMEDRVNRVEASVAGKPRPKVYYVIGFGDYGDYTAGGNTFIGKMLEMAGAVNVADELDGWRYSLEELLLQDPDLIICSRYGHIPEQLKEASGYRELTAVREGKIFPIDNNKLDRQGPRLAEGLQDLARIIHGVDF